jgi:hypothetical protein
MVRATRWAVVFGVLMATGCGERRYDVQGRVAYDDGTPFTGGGLVVLEGLVDGKNVMARGAIRPDGTFTLQADRPGQRVRAGAYRARLVPPPGADVDGPAAKLPYADRFLDGETSGLAIDVGPASGQLMIALGPRP